MVDNQSAPCYCGVARPPNSSQVDHHLTLTTYEMSQTDTHGRGCGSLGLKSRSQKKASQYCDTALMRHTFRNECTEANFGAREVRLG